MCGNTNCVLTTRANLLIQKFKTDSHESDESYPRVFFTPLEHRNAKWAVPNRRFLVQPQIKIRLLLKLKLSELS